LLLVSLLAAGIHAQGPASAPLQGRWVVTGGEHGGKPMDSIAGGVMSIVDDAFAFRSTSP
jgi:hypothetical protein